MQGRIQDFQIEGGAKDYVHVAHKGEVPNTAGVQVPLRGTRCSMLRDLDAFSCSLSLILKYSDTNLILKKEAYSIKI